VKEGKKRKLATIEILWPETYCLLDRYLAIFNRHNKSCHESKLDTLCQWQDDTPATEHLGMRFQLPPLSTDSMTPELPAEDYRV
jgi:hypothetical protein